MLDRLSTLLVEANADPAVRVVVLTGTGRAFCAGLDLIDATQGDGIGGGDRVQPATIDLRTAPPTVLFAMDKPVIGALNGSAAGYGMDLAIGYDIAIMAAGAKLARVREARRGARSGGAWLLPRMIGWAKAAELIFTGRTLSAAESLDLGLVNRVVPDAEVLDVAMGMARDIAANAPLAVQAAKRMMRMGLDGSVRRTSSTSTSSCCRCSAAPISAKA
ncbi:enoyl-CoA hydratase/isomerase family protein [Sphingomonas sp. MMS24-JH45]